MLNYTNQFTCFLNENKTEFIITFSQERPIISTSGSIGSVEKEVVASIAMTSDLAFKLKEHIENLLGAAPK